MADSNEAGRPTKYSVEYAKQAQKLCELGATDAQLADFFEVDLATINRWKLRHSEFCESLKLGKEVPDSNVIRSLYHRAIGYSHPDVDIRTVSIGDGMSEIVQTPITKHYPPDTTAAIFWLKNRMKDEWRNNPEEGGADNDLIGAMHKLIEKLPG